MAAFAFLALLTAGLQMVEPLFMRHIIDRVLLNTGLDKATRMNISIGVKKGTKESHFTTSESGLPSE